MPSDGSSYTVKQAGMCEIDRRKNKENHSHSSTSLIKMTVEAGARRCYCTVKAVRTLGITPTGPASLTGCLHGVGVGTPASLLLDSNRAVATRSV